MLSFNPLVIGGNDGGLGIQGSLIAFMFCPFPIHFLKPQLSRSLPQQMLLHVKDGQFPSLASKKPEFMKYLACKICETREFGFCNILNACLAKSA